VPCLGVAATDGKGTGASDSAQKPQSAGKTRRELQDAARSPGASLGAPAPRTAPPLTRGLARVPLPPSRRPQDERLRFFCQTCPYLQPLEEAQRVAKRVVLTRKKADDILGGDKAWENVDQTDATCPECNNKRAYYMQIQIRSADEPMTIFYRCTACKKMWSSN
jgi:DNA-directed RNA polymerase III subunit RPC11